MRNTNNNRSVLQSIKIGISSTVQVVGVVAEFAVETLTIGKETVVVGMKSTHASTVREENLNNIVECEDAFDVCDERLTELEAVSTEGLTPGQIKRLKQKTALWEGYATIVESTTKL